MRGKNIFLGMLAVMLLMLSPAFAECEYTPGDIVVLPQIATEETADYEYEDGNVSYLYCLYEARNGEGEVVYSGNYQIDGGLDNPCPAEELQLNLTYGNNTYHAIIYSVNMVNEGQGWKSAGSTINVLNETKQIYTACYNPPDPAVIWEIVKAFICELFPFWFCGT